MLSESFQGAGSSRVAGECWIAAQPTSVCIKYRTGHHVARLEDAISRRHADARNCRDITKLAIIPGAQAGSYLAYMRGFCGVSRFVLRVQCCSRPSGSDPCVNEAYCWMEVLAILSSSTYDCQGYHVCIALRGQQGSVSLRPDAHF
jgi:hypothetical protein